MMHSPILNTQNLSIGYSGKIIAHQLSFSLEAGEILCLLGPNGVGKTTLFRTLLKIIPPISGEIYLLEKSIKQWHQKALSSCLGYVPQAHSNIFQLSVQEVVLMGRTPHIQLFSNPDKLDVEKTLNCLKTLGILHLAPKAYHAISGGERQLVLIARALAQETKVLIMDEPTANLDFGNQIRVLEHIKTLKQLGIAILLSTHQPEHAFDVANKVAIFKNGRITSIGTPESIMTDTCLAELYDVSTEQVHQRLKLARRQ